MFIVAIGVPARSALCKEVSTLQEIKNTQERRAVPLFTIASRAVTHVEIREKDVVMRDISTLLDSTISRKPHKGVQRNHDLIEGVRIDCL